MHFLKKILIFALLATLMIAMELSAAAAQSSAAAEDDYEFHSVVPLGIDTIQLEPAKVNVNLLASAESSDFEGEKRVGSGNHARLVNASGETVSVFPDDILFRFTASTHGTAIEPDALPIQTQTDVNDYLLGFRFKLKVFSGLKATTIEPEQVRIMGMPADIPYDERIYLISFHLDRVPAGDRIVLEVWDKDGQRVDRFHLELM